MLYILATWTGFRRGELAALTPLSFDFESDTPSIRLPARFSKRRKAELMPLHPSDVERVKTWLAAKPDLQPSAPLFELRTRAGYPRKTSKMMRLDLERAGVPYKDEQGLFADFHANRHTFISNLSRAGVSLATAQKLARHSDPRLTAWSFPDRRIRRKPWHRRATPARRQTQRGLGVGKTEPKQSG